MKIIKPSYEILTPIEILKDIPRQIEMAGRTCYKSENNINENSAEAFCRGLIRSGHEAMIEHGNSISVKFICDRGISHELVRHRLFSFAQESTRYVSSSNIERVEFEDIDCIELYQDGLSMKKISELSNGKYTEWGVNKILIANDIEKRPKGSRGLFFENYFDKIDTPEKAYLLGLIYADGSIRKDGSGFTISQKEEDEWYIINMIRNFIQPKAKTLHLYNKHITNALIEKGIKPNKTYDFSEEDTNKLWNAVEPFIYDFIRGFLDGDGNIRWFYQNENSKTLSCNIGFTSTNHFLLEKIIEQLTIDFNYTPKLKQEKDNTFPVYRVYITDSNIGRQFCDKIYTNFKFPYGHTKTARYYEAFNYDIPINYNVIESSKNFYVIKPSSFNGISLWIWGRAMLNSELAYQKMIENGATPQEARSILPNSLKTEIIVTGNVREWRHFFQLRAFNSPTNKPHPQMIEIARPLYDEFSQILPSLFSDIGE